MTGYQNGSSGIGWGGVDWIHMTQDKGKWRNFANTVMNLRVIFFSDSQEGLCSMELIRYLELF